jgi:hypothetical protein
MDRRFSAMARLRRRRGMAGLAVVVLSACLAACGGGSDPADPPPSVPTITAMDDQFTVTAGPAAALSVLTNDSMSGASTPALSVASLPLHGKVTVQGATLQYTADAGYYGTDQFTYRAELGAASGTATVKLTVEAELEFSGKVSPGGNGMEVTAQVGDRQFTTTTDAQGAYKLAIKNSRADAFVTLGAKGSGSKATLAMGSLVGDFSVLVAASKAQKLNETMWPALTLDALSSARQGLLAQKGSLPSSSTALRNGVARTDPDDLIDTVNQFRRVAEGGASLPEGVQTTLKLVSDASALASANRKALAGSDGFTGMSATTTAVADVSPPTVGATGSLLAVAGTASFVFDLKPDGRASFFDFDQNGIPKNLASRWEYEGDSLRITVTESYVGGLRTYGGFLLRTVRSVDPQTRPELILREYARPPGCAGAPELPQCEFVWSEWKPVVSFDVQRDKLPLTMADFAPNTRWAGVVIPTTWAMARCLCSDNAETTFDGTLDKGPTKGQLVAGSLLFSGDEPYSGKYAQRYTRLWQGEDNLEYWLAESELHGVTANRVLRAVVKAPEAKLDAAKAARRWLILDSPNQFNPSESGSQHILYSDGRWQAVQGKPIDNGPSSNWKLRQDGKELVLLANSFAQAGEFNIAAAVSGGYLAFARGTLVRMRDLGSAD